MKMNLDHWYVGENGISISLLKYYVDISINTIDERLYYTLTVIDSEMKELNLVFYSLEEAVNFTENRITQCENYNEIIDNYKEIIINTSNTLKYKKR